MDIEPARRVAVAEPDDALPPRVREATERFSDHMDECGYCNETELDKHVEQCANCIRLRRESRWGLDLCGFGEILAQWCIEGQCLELELRELEDEHRRPATRATTD